MGISNEYTHFSHLRKSYLEALEVVETSVFLNKGSVFALNYCDLGIKRYLKDIYKKNITEKATHVIDEIKLSLSTKEQAVFYMGISNEYTHFSHLRKSYLEALEVVETSVFLNKGSVFALNYCDLGIKRYLKDIYKKNIA